MPSVIIGIANHKARKYKEKIYGKISVVDDLIKRAGGMGFENVKANYHNSGYAPESIKYKIMRFCS